MIVLVEGTDYVFKKVTLDWFKGSWGHCDLIWATDHTPEWVASYVVMHNNVIVRNADGVVDMLAEYLKPNRDKNWLFEAEELPSSTFKRRVQRLGQWITCLPGTDTTKQKIADLARMMGFPPEQASSFLSLTEAYQHFVIAKLTSSPLKIESRSSSIWDVLFWRPSISKMSVKELISVIGGLSRLVSLSRDRSANKWRLVQECIRIAPHNVNEFYGAATYLLNHPLMIEEMVDRATKMSGIIEMESTTPVSYLQHKLK